MKQPEYKKILKLYNTITNRYLTSLGLDPMNIMAFRIKAVYNNKKCLIAYFYFNPEHTLKIESVLKWLINIDENLQKSNIQCHVVFDRNSTNEEHKIVLLEQLTYD